MTEAGGEGKDSKPFKVDVDALFGEQAVRENEVNASMRRGTRLHARKQSLTHSRSFATLMSKHAGMTIDQVANFEILEMRKAENEQRRSDNFWGFDKELIDVRNETASMTKEDEFSRAHETYCATTYQQQCWREEEERRKANDKYIASLNEESARNMYMKSFYSSEKSGDIMKFKWPTRPEVKCDEELIAADMALSGSESKPRTAGDFEIWTLAGEPSTIHLEGLQQSRTVSMNGETYDPRKTASIADLAMRPAGTRKNRPTHSASVSGRPHSAAREGSGPVPSSSSHCSGPMDGIQMDSSRRGSISGNQVQSPRETGNSRHAKETNKAILNEITQRHCCALDGHPMFKWNATDMLRTAFNILDSKGTGRLRREVMVDIANNADVQDCLRFTVFWMSVKKRRWSFFYALFDEMEDSIGMEEWLKAAKAVSLEEKVSLRQVRTEAEHKQIVTASGGHMWSIADGKEGSELKAAFASEAREHLRERERGAKVLRQLLPGDFVWGLYNKGCVWLPAKIVKVNREDDTFDLLYLSSSDDVREAQLSTANRQFLPRRVNKKNERLAVKAYASESAVCAHVFDIMMESIEAEGPVASKKLDCAVIAAELKSKRFEDIVRTSVALSTVTADEFHMLEILEIAFVESSNKCNKSEFVEFCNEAVDLITYKDNSPQKRQ